MVSGLAGVVIAILAQSVIASLTVFYSVLGVSLFVPVVVGLHRWRPPARAILSGAAVGVLVFLLAPADGTLPPPLLGIAASATVVFLHLRTPQGSRQRSV